MKYIILASIFWLLTINSLVAQEDIGKIQQGLTALGSSVWSTPTCEVCWENPNANNQTERNWVRDVVKKTWESECGFTFTGWGQCAANNRGIRILIEDSHPHVKRLGNGLDGMRNGMVLNFVFNNWNTDLRSNRKFGIEAIAVHEFGHAIGFAHEHNDCTFSGCSDAPQGATGDYRISVCDLYSVMNYCNPNWNGNGELSHLDVLGAVALYGPPLSDANAFSAVMAGKRLTVFKRNSKGYLTHKYWDDSKQKWSNWIDLGTGEISSAPSAVMANGRLVVFARTMHGTLTHKYFDDQTGKWTDWIHLGEGEISSAPSAVMANGRLVVFARTMHGTLTHKYFDDQTGNWTEWAHLGEGVISSSPSAIMAGNRLTVFARTMHGTLTHKFYDPEANGWTDWIHIGEGEISSVPSAIMAGDRLTIFARTMHKTLTHRYYDAISNGWTDWIHLE